MAASSVDRTALKVQGLGKSERLLKYGPFKGVGLGFRLQGLDKDIRAFGSTVWSRERSYAGEIRTSGG